MKIIILENKIKNESLMKNGINQAINHASSIGYNLEITYQSLNKVFNILSFSSDIVQKGFMIDPQEILDCVDGTHDVVTLIYDSSSLVPQPTNPISNNIKKGNCVPMQIPEQWYGAFDYVLAEFFLHELCHCLYVLTNNSNDQTHFKYTHSEFSQKSNIEWYLFLMIQLKPAWDARQNINTGLTSPYKYFKLNEKTGTGEHTIAELKHEFVKLLDAARGLAGVPIKITSGYRTPTENIAVGGTNDSSHETGLAADILVKDSISGEKINAALHKVGLNRFGYYKDGHIHVDYDLTKPNPCYWVK